MMAEAADSSMAVKVLVVKVPHPILQCADSATEALKVLNYQLRKTGNLSLYWLSSGTKQA